MSKPIKLMRPEVFAAIHLNPGTLMGGLRWKMLPIKKCSS